MPVSLSIKQVPDRIVARLRDRAKQNHRSLQGELLVILEQSTGRESIDIDELGRAARTLGLRTPSGSARMIREDRDAR